MNTTPLLDSHFIQRLERYSLSSRKRLSGLDKGERRSFQYGNSVEFVDHRHYVAGDDLRQIDWNAYGRLDSLYLKRFEDEQTFTLSLLIDTSRSMDWGQPNKLMFARQLAASLGYLALVGLDRVTVATLSDRIINRFGPARGRRAAHVLFDFLSSSASNGRTNLHAALQTFVNEHHQPGLAVLLSDLLVPEGFETGIGMLLHRRYQVVVLHLLAPDEIEPTDAGDFRLVDRETGRAIDLTLDRRAVDLYRQRFEHWTSGIAEFCRRRSVVYERISTNTPLEDVVFKTLRRNRIVR